jgi:ferrous iron transport protein B
MNTSTASVGGLRAAAPTPVVPSAALVGNPNTGKTSLFNLLTGARRRVGNYPGVTVERVSGRLKVGDREVELIDLPGTYSLAARSPDEMIVADTLLGQQRGTQAVSAAIVVIDASNLERNLFLASQVIDTGLPTVIALNMIDIAERHGIRIDVALLAQRLQAAVVPIQARSGRGREALLKALNEALVQPRAIKAFAWPEVVEKATTDFAAAIAQARVECPPRCEVRRCLLDVDGYAEQRLAGRLDCAAAGLIAEHRKPIEAAGFRLPVLEAESRYIWIRQLLGECVTQTRAPGRSSSSRIDDVVTHRLFGTIIFIVVMGAIFVSVFSWAAPLMDAVDSTFGALGALLHAKIGEGVLASLLADGVVAGVGGVLVFLPQILILFALITILEDCGYLARAAFLMDRLLRWCGMSGRSFVPLLSSFACAIPGIMAARTIESRRDRLITILVAPLMSCSARIPVYTLLVAAFVPRRMLLGFLPLQGLVFAALYFVGVIVAAGVGTVLRHTLLKGEESPFLLELPTYKWPSLRSVAMRMYDRGKDFLFTAGTIILALSIIIWALMYFPRSPQVAEQTRQQLVAAGETDPEVIDRAISGAYLRQSVLGRVGHAIEPGIRPLGWDWKIGIAVLAAFPAREVVISTLGIIYNLGPEVDEQTPALRDKLRAATSDGRATFTVPSAISLMVFFALCCQCQATVAVIKRETRSWGWAIFAFSYMTVLGYVGALVVYQVGSRLGA